MAVGPYVLDRTSEQESSSFLATKPFPFEQITVYYMEASVLTTLS
jgi:hypothetical protein